MMQPIPPEPRDDPVRSERRRVFSVQLMAVGFLVYALSSVVALAAGNAPGAVTFLPLCLVAAFFAVFVFATGRLMWPALVFAILFVLLSPPEELLHPESFADFVPALWRLFGAAAAVVGGVVTVRQRRRRSSQPAGHGQRNAALAAAGLLLVCSAGSLVMTSSTRASIDQVTGAMLIVTSSANFRPDALELRSGHRVAVHIRNEDPYAHTFAVEGSRVDEYIPPDGDVLVRLDLTRPGSYEFRCNISGHDGMKGRIRVFASGPP